MSSSSLVSLGEGIYTVPQVCRILQPTMTPRKVHYWLHTELLPPPLYWGSRGHPTLLGFQHLLQIHTAQRLRDELSFSLKRVRGAFEWIFERLFAPDWTDLQFSALDGNLIVTAGNDAQVVPGGQGILPLAIATINRELSRTRLAWDTGRLIIPSYPRVVSDTRIQAGAPTVSGTRLETSFIASFADADTYTDEVVGEILSLYPPITKLAIHDALTFEGLSLAS